MKESYISRDFRETTAKRFPSRAEELNAAFGARLQALRAENAGASREKTKHLERQILPGIAAYETLQTFMPKDEAWQTIHGYVEQKARRAHKYLTAMLRVPGLYRLVPGIFVKSTRTAFGPDICIRYGCPELCRCFCDSDDISYDGLHPRLVWRRTGTLGRGNACCDFCLKIKE